MTRAGWTIGLVLGVLAGCDDAGSDRPATADATADNTAAATAWVDAPSGPQLIGQGQTRQFPVLVSPAGAVATVASATGVEAQLTDGQLAVHAGYTDQTAATVSVQVSDTTAAPSQTTLALTVQPLGWQQAVTWGANGPEAREHGAMIHDAAADRVVLIGGSGYQPYLSPLDDVWALDLTTRTWTQLKPTGDVPTGGGSRRVAHIPGSQIAYLFGGYGTQGASNRELYRVDFSATQPVFTKLTFSAGPTARSLHAFAYDAVTERFFVFGGVDNAPRNDTWVLTITGDTPKWSKLTTINKPSARYGFFSAVDEATGRLIVYSGAQGTATLDPADDTWALDMRSETPDWQQVSAGGGASDPPGRRNGCAVWDPNGPRLVVFGGTADAKTSAPGLYALDARPGKMTWHKLDLSNEPELRSSGFGLYDPKRNQLLLGFGNTSSAVFQDLQVLGY
jgi:hypothetical protein